MIARMAQASRQKDVAMSIFTPGLIAAGVFFILSLASGIWLTSLGKPVNVVVVTIHKLISLGTVVFTGIVISNLSRATDISSFEVGAIMITGLLFILLFVTGTLSSTGKPVKMTPRVCVVKTKEGGQWKQIYGDASFSVAELTKAKPAPAQKAAPKK